MTEAIAEQIETPVLAPSVGQSRMPMLDGWRGISILSVLACHLLPLGPKWMRLNEAAGLFGMSLFFTLSGFLITAALYRQPQVRPFLIRRLCRILPLAYVYATGAMIILGKGAAFYAAHYLFLINYQFQYITELTGHFWSLCVEVQFYLGVAVLVALGGRRALLLLPALALLVTGLRVWTGTYASIVTHLRVDEILSGATMGLLTCGALSFRVRDTLRRVPWYVWLAALLVSCHSSGGAVNYLRPYLAAGLVGCTVWNVTRINRFLEGRVLRYVAETSYALYVIHPLAGFGWLGTGGAAIKYLLKRPITLAVTFAAAHLSTFYFEHRWITLGKGWAKRVTSRQPGSSVMTGNEP